MKFCNKDFLSDQIRSFIWIRSHLLKKFLMENFIFCAVNVPWFNANPSIPCNPSALFSN